MLKLYNTYSDKLEGFKPIENNKVIEFALPCSNSATAFNGPITLHSPIVQIASSLVCEKASPNTDAIYPLWVNSSTTGLLLLLFKPSNLLKRPFCFLAFQIIQPFSQHERATKKVPRANPFCIFTLRGA